MRTTGKAREGPGAKRNFLLGLVALLFSVSASGLEPTAMRFDRLSMNEGLSQSAVMAIAQDQTGFMWFATESGLDRYDGSSFNNYRSERGVSDSLAADFVRDLDLADDGSLWVATDGGGVSRWRPDSDKFTTYRNDPDNVASLAADRIRSVLADSRGFIWIGTRDSGLDRLEVTTGAITHYAHAPGDETTLSNNQVYALALDKAGMLWIGTQDGLNRLNPATGVIKRFLSRPGDDTSLGDDRIRSLLVDHAGTLWVGTRGSGLSRFDFSAGRFTNFVHSDSDRFSVSSNLVKVIFEDDKLRLWIGTDNGLNLMDTENGRFTAYRHDPTDASSLSDNFVFSIHQDRAGVLWVGTRTAGLSKWNPRSWSFGHFRPTGNDAGGSSDPNVTSFVEDTDGRLWVGTFGGGVNVMDRDNDSIIQLRHDPEVAGSLSDDRVMALLTDRRGRVWVGTMSGGLNRFRSAESAARVYRHDPDDPDSLAADGVMSMMEDSQGRIWVGTFGGGVSRLDHESGVFTNFEHDPTDKTTLSGARATAIVEDAGGGIWVGTDGGGLNQLDESGSGWRRLTHSADDPFSLSANTVYTLHTDLLGNLWVGTRAGLDRLTIPTGTSERLRFHNIAIRRGQANNPVYGIRSDAAGNLWLSTNRGLVRYNLATGAVREFHESQGLQGEEFNFGASYSNADGELFFGGSNGFNAFAPTDLEFNHQPPPLVLTSFSILNKPVAMDKPYDLIERIDLDYSDDVVTFGISALDFAAPEKNHYAYRLEGFDDSWVYAGNERRITYTNLDGGNYTLRVKAANSDDVWNEEGISIPLSVAYPPWQRWWAYTLYLLLVIGSAWAFWRQQQIKLEREAEYSRRLEQEVRTRTKELHNRNADLKDANTKLLEASTTDPLTGLRNRRFLYEQITKDVDLVLRHYRDGTETMKPGGNNDLLFLMVDLDHFKPVNDSCGHEAGDDLLLQIRDVLLDACRYSDDVIRWGGDEFLVVARETNRNYAATLAERIRAGLSQRVFSLGNGQVARITASIGYASYPFIKDRPDLLTWEEVLGVADAAMYEAKERRNAWIGIDGLEWPDSGDELYRAIKTDPGKLAEDGAIRAIESIEETEEGYGS